jgi:hypothetical protein
MRGPERSGEPLGSWTMDELLEDHAAAADVIARHGIDPRTRCHAGVRGHLPLRTAFRSVCRVDDAVATLADLEELTRRS